MIMDHEFCVSLKTVIFTKSTKLMTSNAYETTVLFVVLFASIVSNN